ncbi:MAG: hypothetical protein JNJ58_05480 [Chitinophagaceae bacterium]|nr:hypothetical protein [Chitinophagaceae bacterium]
MKFKVIILLLFFSKLSLGQIDDSKFRSIVLNKSIVGKKFTFGECNQRGGQETTLIYLGSVKSRKGKTYKIMNSIWTWGMSCRATSRILIFNDQNQYIGNYYIFDSCDLPTKIENGYLIFKNVSNGCDRKMETTINLKNGIPKSVLGNEFES